MKTEKVAEIKQTLKSLVMNADKVEGDFSAFKDVWRELEGAELVEKLKSIVQGIERQEDCLPAIRTMDAVKAFLKSCQAKNLSPRSIIHYEGALKRLVGQCEWLPNKPEQIEDFTSQFTGATKEDYFKVVRTFYKFLLKRELIRSNPTDKLDRPKVKKKMVPSLSGEELLQLLNQPLSQRDVTIFMLLASTGLRVGETINLNFEHINGDILKVPHKGKTGERLVPLTAQVRDALLALKDGCGEKDAIFRGRSNKRLQSEPAYLRLTQKAFRQAGLDKERAHPHCLRHTFARLWITQGGDVESLRRILGHSTIQQTINYVNLVCDDLVAKNEKHNPLLGLNFSLPQGGSSIAPLESSIASAESSKTL